jgi:hypothetical protein
MSGFSKTIIMLTIIQNLPGVTANVNLANGSESVKAFYGNG